VETRFILELQNTFLCRQLTLGRYTYVKDTSRSSELVNVHLRRKTILLSELENKLVEYCVIIGQSYYGLRRQDTKCMAFQLALRNGLKHPFTQEKSEAEKEVLRSFNKGIQ